jgi:hypothetical protein
MARGRVVGCGLRDGAICNLGVLVVVMLWSVQRAEDLGLVGTKEEDVVVRRSCCVAVHV